jgi:hypothetical protein
MSQPPTGPYPVYSQYPQYPTATALPKPPIPRLVQWAFFLMLGGAALEVVSIIVTFTQVNQLRQNFDQFQASNPVLSTSNVDVLVKVTLASAVIGGAIGTGLWIWMAFANRAGHAWARTTGTVFFAVSVVSTLGTLAVAARAHGGSDSMLASNDTAPGKVLGFISLLLGLLTVIMLWSKQSRPFFNRPPIYSYPQGQVPGYFAPGYPYPAQFPGPGQQPGPTAQPSAPEQPGDPWALPPKE